MDKLPEEIERLVFSFIPIEILALCTKEYWIKNNKHTVNKLYIFGKEILLNQFKKENIFRFKRGKVYTRFYSHSK